MNLFLQCPHKYYRLRLRKDIVEPETEAMRYGKVLHAAAEHYVRDGKPLDEGFLFLKPILDIFVSSVGDKYCELKLGLTREWEPCDFFAPNVWWRGIADLVIINGSSAKLIDYKTGKSAKYADTKQLALLALALFKHFPQLQTIRSGLLFVIADAFVEASYKPSILPKLYEDWTKHTALLEAAMTTGVWNRKQNFTCRKHCPIMDCPHNGRS